MTIAWTVRRTHRNMVLILFGLFIFGTVAFGEYENTKWGMSPDSVAKLYPGGKLVREVNGDLFYNVVKPVAGYNFSLVRFMFTKNRLDGLYITIQQEYSSSLQKWLPKVKKKVEVDKTFTDLQIKLRTKYGQEAAVEKNSARWDVSADLVVILEKELLLPNECTSLFRNGCGLTVIYYKKPRSVIDLANEQQEGL